MATLEQGITARVKAQVSGVSNRVYPNRAPQNATVPYIIYSRISTGRMPTLTEQGLFQVTYQFDIVGSSYSNMITIRTALRTAFEDVTGAYTAGAPTVQATEIVSEQDGFDDSLETHTGILEITFIHG